MKKQFHAIILSLVLVFVVYAPAGAAYLDSPAKAESVLTLKDLGSPEIVMHGPYGTGSVRFNVPANWILQDGAYLQLSVDSFISGDQPNANPADEYLGAMLDVFFNGVLQTSLPLKSGTEIIYNVPIRSSD